MMSRPFVIPMGMGDMARTRHAKNRAFMAKVQARGVCTTILAGTTGCRFIESDPRDPGAHWCGARRVPGRAWCAKHMRRVFVVMM